MSTAETRRIVAGFDGSDNARAAVGWAEREALGRDALLLVAQAFSWYPPAAESSTARWLPAEPLAEEPVRNAAKEELSALVDEIRQRSPELEVEMVFRDGPAAAVLGEVADEAAADLLVVGGSGLSAIPRMVLGSTAAEVIHSVTRPVVVVRGEEPGADAPVVVGVDGSPTSSRAIGFAFEFAARHGCQVNAVHAWSDLPLAVPDAGRMPSMETGEFRQMAEEYLGGWRARYPDVPVDWRVVADRPGRALIEQAEGARLLVVGSHGRGALRRALLGSVSRAVLHHAHCPVAVLREVPAD